MGHLLGLGAGTQFALGPPMFRLQAEGRLLVAAVLFVSSCGTFVTETYLNGTPATVIPWCPESRRWNSGTNSQRYTA
jgi:hypothetical protein